MILVSVLSSDLSIVVMIFIDGVIVTETVSERGLSFGLGF